MIGRTLVIAALLAGSPAAAQQADAGRQAQRDLFERIIEIPTVEGRTAEFKRLTTLLTAELRKAGITNVVVKDHDNTQTLIARWPAARPSGTRTVSRSARRTTRSRSPGASCASASTRSRAAWPG